MTVLPVLLSQLLAHSASIGATSVDPAPVIVAADAAEAATALPALARTAVTVRVINLLRCKVCPFQA